MVTKKPATRVAATRVSIKVVPATRQARQGCIIFLEITAACVPFCGVLNYPNFVVGNRLYNCSRSIGKQRVYSVVYIEDQTAGTGSSSASFGVWRIYQV